MEGQPVLRQPPFTVRLLGSTINARIFAEAWRRAGSANGKERGPGPARPRAAVPCRGEGHYCSQALPIESGRRLMRQAK